MTGRDHAGQAPRPQDKQEGRLAFVPTDHLGPDKFEVGLYALSNPVHEVVLIKVASLLSIAGIALIGNTRFK